MDTQTLAGTVQSGGTSSIQPIPGAVVTLYEATTGDPTAIASATTGTDGRFSLQNVPATTDSIFYATARRGHDVLLATVIGTGIDGEIVINELTTVAAAFSMNQFANGDVLSGSAFGLRIAAGMNRNLVDPGTGAPSEVLLSPPNADQTNTLRSTRSLANLVAACVRRAPGKENAFFTLAAPPGGTAPADTFQALLSIARNPANHARALYNQSQGVQTVYSPPLFSAPDAWTLAVKVNDSGDDEFLFGGPANVAFDERGYAWIGNNVVQGTPNSGNFIIVLRPDGKPADGSDGTPKSPVFGGGLNGPGWGVTVSPKTGNVWVGNFGWGPKEDFPQNGTVSEFAPDGTPLSGDDGYGSEQIQRVQAAVADADGNIWMASFGNSNIAVFLGGDPTQVRWADGGGTNPFGISLGPDGTVWMSNSGGLGWPQAGQGSVSRFTLQGDQVMPPQQTPLNAGAACKVIATDSQGYAWLASGGDSTVYQFDPQGNQIGAFTGVGGIDAPWGLCVDGDDNVWVGNFGKLGLTSDYTWGGLTVLAGANEATRPAGIQAGDPISPPTGYTVLSAGEPVLLHNGEPLYTDGTECYTPFMRTTSCQIDQAGNVWVVNNWKPRFRTDWEPKHGNPGGDGIVIFVGLAKPPKIA